MLNLGHINVFYSKTPKDNSITFDICRYYSIESNVLFLTYSKNTVKSMPLSQAQVKIIPIQNNLNEILNDHTFRVDLIIIDEIWSREKNLSTKEFNLLKRFPIPIILNVGDNIQRHDYSGCNQFIYQYDTMEKLIEDRQTKEKLTLEAWKQKYLRNWKLNNILKDE